MTTEADQNRPPTLAELAAAMEDAAALYTSAKDQLDVHTKHERAAFQKANLAKRAFNDAVNAMKPKRPKKATAATTA